MLPPIAIAALWGSEDDGPADLDPEVGLEVVTGVLGVSVDPEWSVLLVSRSAKDRVTSSSEASAVRRALGFEIRTVARAVVSAKNVSVSLATSDASDSTVKNLES